MCDTEKDASISDGSSEENGDAESSTHLASIHSSPEEQILAGETDESTKPSISRDNSQQISSTLNNSNSMKACASAEVFKESMITDDNEPAQVSAMDIDDNSNVEAPVSKLSDFSFASLHPASSDLDGVRTVDNGNSLNASERKASSASETDMEVAEDTTLNSTGSNTETADISAQCVQDDKVVSKPAGPSDVVLSSELTSENTSQIPETHLVSGDNVPRPRKRSLEEISKSTEAEPASPDSGPTPAKKNELDILRYVPKFDLTESIIQAASKPSEESGEDEFNRRFGEMVDDKRTWGDFYMDSDKHAGEKASTSASPAAEEASTSASTSQSTEILPLGKINWRLSHAAVKEAARKLEEQSKELDRLREFWLNEFPRVPSCPQEALYEPVAGSSMEAPRNLSNVHEEVEEMVDRIMNVIAGLANTTSELSRFLSSWKIIKEFYPKLNSAKKAINYLMTKIFELQGELRRLENDCTDYELCETVILTLSTSFAEAMMVVLKINVILANMEGQLVHI